MKLPLFLHRIGLPVVRNALPGFDAVYYRYWYRDVEMFGAAPLVHYVTFGWKEGRDPSAGFSSSGYLTANPDVVALDICPLIHFLERGLSEGRRGWQKNSDEPPPKPKLLNEPLKLLAPPIPSGRA